MNTKELVKKATEGKLSPRELAEVVTCLETETCDPYEALLVIGRSGALEYRTVVEKYLRARHAPMLARLALMILCRYWGLSAEYTAELRAFIQKLEWDEEEDVRLLAIAIVGSLLAQHRDDNFLRLLIDIFHDRSGSDSQMIREEAYCALALAYGKSPRDLPQASRHFDLEHDVDSDVVAYIEAEERRLTGRRVDPGAG